MKGFMDLVFLYEGRFFLIDWKSNFLGASIEDYRTEALSEVMREELYLLQYHLYVVALHQYLKTRLTDYDYKTHFGGVMYIFLRGVNTAAGPHAGIYRDRPAKKAVEFLCKKLIAILIRIPSHFDGRNANLPSLPRWEGQREGEKIIRFPLPSSPSHQGRGIFKRERNE